MFERDGPNYEPIDAGMYFVLSLPFKLVNVVEADVPWPPRLFMYLILQFVLTLQPGEPCDSWAEEYIFWNRTS